MLASLLFTGVVSVMGTADCATIRDHDSRMICFAHSTGQESYCGFVRDADKRVMCRAMVKQ